MKSAVFVLLLSFVSQTPIRTKSIADPLTYVLSSDNIEWPSKAVRNVYGASGRYIDSNIIPTRFQAHGLHAVLAYPRLKPGVPITLGKIPLLTNRLVPDVKPFPNWDMQEEGNCNAIQNAVDVYLDEKKILWVLDTGWVNTLVAPKQLGRPRVWGLNFYTGKILHEIDLSEFATPRSKFQNVVTEHTMNRPFVYVSCAETCSVIVWDVTNAKGRIVELPQLNTVGECLYMVMLRPPKSVPIIVFSHLSYPLLFGVSVSCLRNGNLGQVQNLGEKTCEMVILGTDNGSKMYFRWKGHRQIRVWDLAKVKGEKGEIIGQDDHLRMSTQVAGGSRLLTWTLETNFPDFVAGTLGITGVSAKLKPLVKN